MLRDGSIEILPTVVCFPRGGNLWQREVNLGAKGVGRQGLFVEIGCIVSYKVASTEVAGMFADNNISTSRFHRL